MVEIGLTLRVSSGPIGEPTTLFFYDRSKRKLRASRCARVRAEWQRESGFELEVIGSFLCRNDRGICQIHGRHALTVGVEAVHRPLPRRRKIELIVPRRVTGAQEGLEARVFPETIGPETTGPKTVGRSRSSLRSDADTRHVGPKRIAERDDPGALERQPHIQTLYRIALRGRVCAQEDLMNRCLRHSTLYS